MSDSSTSGAAKQLELAIQNPGCRTDLSLEQLEPWLLRLVSELAPQADSFCLRLTDDDELQKLNSQYRHRDRPTDVLSFPGESSVEGQHLGDVVISVPTAQRQADVARHPLERELRTLALHGVLHCQGYDHETDDGEMERLEDELRQRWLASDDVEKAAIDR